MSTILAYLAGLPRELIVVVISVLPLVELRGAIPVGIMALKLPPWETFVLAMIGNLLPIPIILLVLKPVRRWALHWPVIGGILRWAEARALRHREAVEKHGFWGMVLFVGIPLPGTGAWTGALLAVLLDFPFGRSMLAITIGVILAGVLIAFLSAAGLMALG